MPIPRHRFWSHRVTRAVLVTLGVAMMIGGVLIGPLPGPGFLVVFPIGLALVLKHATWSKRIYARLKRRHPAYGRWTDWALRRPRHKQRPPAPPWRDSLSSGWRGIARKPRDESGENARRDD